MWLCGRAGVWLEWCEYLQEGTNCRRQNRTLQTAPLLRDTLVAGLGHNILHRTLSGQLACVDIHILCMLWGDVMAWHSLTHSHGTLLQSMCVCVSHLFLTRYMRPAVVQSMCQQKHYPHFCPRIYMYCYSAPSFFINLIQKNKLTIH